jgi:hypothetical protein
VADTVAAPTPSTPAPRISESDTAYWIANRAAIIDAITAAGFELLSNKNGWWLSPKTSTPAPAEISQHDVSTSTGGRAYVAEFFSKRLKRHDFARYITDQLAADFACALAGYLRDHETTSPTRTDVGEARESTPAPSDDWVHADRAYSFERCGLIPTPIDPRLAPEPSLYATPPTRPDVGDARDAARYRWLRDFSNPGICAFYLSVGKAFDGVKFNQDTVDAAIDAQIAASTPTPQGKEPT